MESTLFTALTPNQEANLSGGTTGVKKSIALKLSYLKVAFANNSTTQTATTGAGGDGGVIAIGGFGPTVLVKSPVSANGGNSGDATNFNSTSQGVSN